MRTTFLIIGLNILFYLIALCVGDVMTMKMALHKPDSIFFHHWQWITHMFMHAGWWHLLLNMLTLATVGYYVEPRISKWNYLGLYFVSGLFAAWVQSHLSASPMVGASAAISGVTAALCLYKPDLVVIVFPIPIPVRISFLYPFSLLVGLVLQLTTKTNVAHGAHLAGAAIGFLIALFYLIIKAVTPEKNEIRNLPC